LFPGGLAHNANQNVFERTGKSLPAFEKKLLKSSCGNWGLRCVPHDIVNTLFEESLFIFVKVVKFVRELFRRCDFGCCPRMRLPAKDTKGGNRVIAIVKRRFAGARTTN
jgi:hypothetical protein